MLDKYKFPLSILKGVGYGGTTNFRMIPVLQIRCCVPNDNIIPPLITYHKPIPIYNLGLALKQTLDLNFQKMEHG